MIKKISLALSTCALLSSSLQASSSLKEAITSGKVSGDISLRYESRDFDSEGVGTYYENTAYAVPSLGINYDTAEYNNFSASVGFRAYSVIYEDDKNGKSGNGDSTDRIKNTEGNDQLSKAYVAYANSGFDVKVGRKDIPWGTVDWLSKLNEGVFATYTNESLKVEALYSQRRGRVNSKELFPMADINNGDGIYHSAVTYSINDNYKAKAYYLDAPNSHSTYGGKLLVNHELSNDLTINSMIHFMKTSEDKLANDTDLTEITLGGSISGYSLTLGYVKNDKDNGFGSADDAGEIVVPFEEGDTMYEADASTLYAMLSKTIADISLTALYGTTTYGTADYKSSEFDLWLGYSFTEELSLSFCYAMTSEDSSDSTYSDMDQISATVAYKF